MISIYLSMKYPWISRIAVTIILEMIAACALPMISAFAPPLHLPLEKCLVSVPHEGLRQQHHRCCTAVAVSLRASHGGGVEANEAGPMGWTMHQSMGRRNAGSMILSGALIFGLGGSAMSAELDQEAASARILSGYATLVDLYDNWERYGGKGEVVDGDGVRRRVGTVGNKSPLFGIRKVLLKRGLDLDLFEDLDRLLTKIDSDAYSAIFADSSTAAKRGYEFMADAKDATKKAIKVYKEILVFFDLQP